MSAVTRVPAHGHGRLRVLLPGQSGNPSGHPKVLAEALALARKSAPEMVAELIELARSSPDDRVQTMAATKLLDYAGLPNLAGTAPDDGASIPDLSRLTPEQRRALAAALDTVRGLVAAAGEDGGDTTCE